MAWARKVDFGHLSLNRPRAHPLFPVFKVSIDHLQRYRPTEQATVADSSRYLGGVGFNLHPPTAAMAELAAREVTVKQAAVDLEPGWEPLDYARKAGAVGLSGGCQ